MAEPTTTGEETRAAKPGRRRRRRGTKKAAAVRRGAAKRRGPKPGARRGRPAKNGRRRRPASGLLSLSEIGRRTGISYPTLVRYVKLHGVRLPHRGSGRSRRFLPAAVPIFEQLRRESRRGRPPRAVTAARGAVDGALARSLDRIEAGQRQLLRQIRALVRSLQKPLRVSVRR
jgi:hypothetical protein